MTQENAMPPLTDAEREAIRARCEDGALVPDDTRQLLAEIDRLRAAHAELEKWLREQVKESDRDGDCAAPEDVDFHVGKECAFEAVLSRITKGES